MELSLELVGLAGMMMMAGIIGGLIAGMLGVGGGIVIVPVLDFALGILKVDPSIRMHVAVATSLATIIITSISSTRAHHSRGAVDFDLVRSWAPYIFIGSIIGTVIASQLDSRALSGVFAVVAMLAVIKLLFPFDHVKLTDKVPDGVAIKSVPLAIGGLSTMMGIGGGTVSVPAMTLCGHPIHRAVGTAAFFGLWIAIPGTISYIVSGWGDPRLPEGSLGFVNVIGLLFIGPTTYFAAPWGARIAHGLSKRQLSVFFGLFLLVVSCRMFYRLFQG